MRKITLVLTLVAFAAFVFAQTSPKVMYKDHAATKSDVSFVTHKMINDTKGEAPDWYVNFEESSPVWTVGHESGTTDWFVGGAAQVPDGPNGWGDYEEGWYFFPLGDYSETGNEVGGNWAMLDIIGLFFAGAQEDGEYWIRFDNIDLSNNNAPKLVFYQLFRPLNSVNGYIDFSLDGGNTWTATVEPNEGVNGNDYGSVRKEMLVGEYIGGQSNVSMRFRWVTSIGSPTAPHGYGWQLDDLMIIDAPEHDLKLIKAHMNFFDYFDYTEYEDHRGFHYSTHYGHATKKEYESEHAVMLFNPIIENKGLNAAIPTVNISVIDPNGDEIYNETQVFGTIASGSIDTLDFLVPELHIANPHFGEYTVLYEVSEDGVEDYNDNDN
ncbi:MAG: hypothetical protein GX879_10430, partial [Bacteroidales bacterium]|nr:hypothetical protein [Bacteroidales bacterium]